MNASRYSELNIESWTKFREVLDGAEYESWAFRGHSDSTWKLYSTISRYFIDFGIHKDARPQQEYRSLRIFRRKAHLLLTRVPNEGDSFQWLALMQHHGAPTRLLDFTWSPYVAAFFALERATAKAAIWAIFPPKLNNRMVRTIRASQKVEEDEIGPWIEGNYEQHFLPDACRWRCETRVWVMALVAFCRKLGPTCHVFARSCRGRRSCQRAPPL